MSNERPMKGRPKARRLAAVVATVVVALAASGVVGAAPRPAVAARGTGTHTFTPVTIQLSAHDGSFWAGSTRVTLRGFNVSGVTSKSDLDAIAGWGFNFIRLRFRWADYETVPPVHNPNGTWTHTYDDAGYLAQVEQTISNAQQDGLYVMVGDTGCIDEPPACPYFNFPDYLYQAAYNSKGVTYPQSGDGVQEENTDFWTDANRQQFENDMWAHLSAQLAGVPGIAGYEIRDEPQMGTYPFDHTSTQLALDWQLGVAQTIRANDPNRIVWFMTHEGYGPGIVHADLSGWDALGDVAYDLHDYYGARWGDGLKRSTTPSLDREGDQNVFLHTLNYPAPTYIGNVLSQERFVELQQGAVNAAGGIPLIVGEFGMDGSTDPGVYVYYGTLVSAFNGIGVSWAASYGGYLGILDGSGGLLPWASIVINGAHG